MKSLKEIYQLVLDEIRKPHFDVYRYNGICEILNDFYSNKKITSEEKIIMAVKQKGNIAYLFYGYTMKDNWKLRKQWLEGQIQILNDEENNKLQ